MLILKNRINSRRCCWQDVRFETAAALECCSIITRLIACSNYIETREGTHKKKRMVKGRVHRVYAAKSCSGSRRTASFILNLDIRCRWASSGFGRFNPGKKILMIFNFKSYFPPQLFALSGLQFFSVNLQRVAFKGKGKSVPLQAWRGPEGSKKLRFPDFMTT